MNHNFQDTLLNPWKIVKIWETRPQSSKNGHKFVKNSWFRQKYTGVWFSIAFLCSILKLSTENILKKSWDKAVLKMWSQIFGKKTLFFLFKYTFLSKNFFLKVDLRKNYDFYKKCRKRPTIGPLARVWYRSKTVNRVKNSQ